MTLKPDGRDDFGRGYTEVGTSLQYRTLTPTPCVECSAPICHGWERYFQRRENVPEPDLFTYEVVCPECAHNALRHPVH